MLKLKRSSGNRFYKRLFLRSVEGSETEVEYFKRFNSRYVHVECLHERNKTSPKQVLVRLKSALAKRQMRDGDQAWVVIDRDDWKPEDIESVCSWVRSDGDNAMVKKGLAISNPKFEFWLLLHFSDGSGNETARACVEALKDHLPNYDKHLSPTDITNEGVAQAVQRARKLWGELSVQDWARDCGKTSVFNLVEQILAAEQEEQEKEMRALESAGEKA